MFAAIIILLGVTGRHRFVHHGSDCVHMWLRTNAVEFPDIVAT